MIEDAEQRRLLFCLPFPDAFFSFRSADWLAEGLPLFLCAERFSFSLSVTLEKMTLFPLFFSTPISRFILAR